MTISHEYRIRLPGLLLVEPDPEARVKLAYAMEVHGWHVWVAPDGPTAVEVFRENRELIDVALVDLQLPGLQGGRVLAELGQLNPDLTRCAMSADLCGYTASAFRRVSGTPLFSKPLHARTLAFALNEMVEHAGQG